jgi:hypothetical protein
MITGPVTKVIVKRFRSFPSAVLDLDNPLFVVWADDLKVGLEREIKELDRGIKETRNSSKGAATLAEKLAVQNSQRDLKAQRDRKRRELFARQDEIQVRRDNFINALEVNRPGF